MSGTIPTIIWGGSGFVAGELIRLLAYHPYFEVKAVVSGSRGGEPIASTFPHLADICPGAMFEARAEAESLLDFKEPIAVFTAGPHGESAQQVDRILAAAEDKGSKVRLVDLSADFRYPDAASFQEVYGIQHGAPQRIGEFHCSLPEHGPTRLRRHVGHPGCFTTSVVIPAVALLHMGIVHPTLRVSSVTGSTGSGAIPKPTTHHPVRASNLFAYKPLTHRHIAEMNRLVTEASGTEADIRFVPHSGPFARGIHTTIHADLIEKTEPEAVGAALAEYYADSPFVRVVHGTPRIKDVVGTNQCWLGVWTEGSALVAFSVIDNLVKGAAGGAIQWMNRMFELEDDTGLRVPGLGWF